MIASATKRTQQLERQQQEQLAKQQKEKAAAAATAGPPGIGGASSMFETLMKSVGSTPRKESAGEIASLLL